MALKLDYINLKTPQERIELVNKILAETPPEEQTQFSLSKLSDYIIDATLPKAHTRQKSIITPNKYSTIVRREKSFEGLADQLESGEDGIYGMITEDKNIIFTARSPITQEDIDTVPGLKQLKDEIDKLEAQIPYTYGKKLFALKKQLIEMHQDQYVLKGAYKKPIYSINLIKTLGHIDLSEEVSINSKGDPEAIGFLSFFNPKHILILLQNYSRLKQDSYSDFLGDVKWMIMDLENLIDTHLKYQDPILFEVLVRKIDKMSNVDIQSLLLEKYNKSYNPISITNIWTQTIPKKLAQAAREEYILWYYSQIEYGYWRRCSICHEIKLVHPYFYARDSYSSDGFAKMCKKCKNRIAKERRDKKKKIIPIVKLEKKEENSKYVRLENCS